MTRLPKQQRLRRRPDAFAETHCVVGIPSNYRWVKLSPRAARNNPYKGRVPPRRNCVTLYRGIDRLIVGLTGKTRLNDGGYNSLAAHWLVVLPFCTNVS